MKKLFFSVLALAALTASFAMPTIWGPTGGAQVAGTGIADRVEIAVNQLTSYATQYPAVAVVAPIGDITEVSLAYWQADEDANLFNAGLKVAIPAKNLGVDVAVGGNFERIHNYANKNYENVILFASASKELCKDFTATANYQFITGDLDNNVFAINLEKVVSELTLGAEYIISEDAYCSSGFYGTVNSANVYARYSLNKDVELQTVIAGIGSDNHRCPETIIGGSLKF